MQVHAFRESTSSNRPRIPNKIVTMPLSRADFDAVYKGKTLHTAPKNYESCLPGFVYYEGGDGRIMGIKND